MQRLYEAMFIVDSNKAKDNYGKFEQAVFTCVTRHGGEIVKAIQWDDRRLTYEIKKVRRGAYILVHFQAEGEAIPKIERQVRLSEDLLRVLITVDEDGVETSTGSARLRTEAATAAAASESEAGAAVATGKGGEVETKAGAETA